MSKVRIKNFGPIKEGYCENDGWIEVKKVTVFTGNQGSGKSTVAKVISTLTWLEKALNRGDVLMEKMNFAAFLRYFDYQNLAEYFRKDTIIEYEGDRFGINFDMTKYDYPIVRRKDESNYQVPKIMYVPDGRSFLSVIKNATGVRDLPDTLFDFAEELKRGQMDMNDTEVQLPINDVTYKYDKESDSSYIVGKDYKVNLLAASSGFQSLVPLFLVSSRLANMVSNGSEINPANISVDQSIRMNKEISDTMLDDNYSDEEKLKKVEIIRAKFRNTVFINIVEEPEQNLFPTSQRKILYSLLEFNNMSDGNKLIMTTHSPYLINYLTLCVKADAVLEVIKHRSLERFVSNMMQLEQIVTYGSYVAAHDIVIYEMNEVDGTIKKLGSFEGIPSDTNVLNKLVGEINDLYDRLLDIEEGI